MGRFNFRRGRGRRFYNTIRAMRSVKRRLGFLKPRKRYRRGGRRRYGRRHQGFVPVSNPKSGLKYAVPRREYRWCSRNSKMILKKLHLGAPVPKKQWLEEHRANILKMVISKTYTRMMVGNASEKTKKVEAMAGIKANKVKGSESAQNVGSNVAHKRKVNEVVSEFDKAAAAISHKIPRAAQGRATALAQGLFNLGVAAV